MTGVGVARSVEFCCYRNIEVGEVKRKLALSRSLSPLHERVTRVYRKTARPHPHARHLAALRNRKNLRYELAIRRLATLNAVAVHRWLGSPALLITRIGFAYRMTKHQ